MKAKTSPSCAHLPRNNTAANAAKKLLFPLLCISPTASAALEPSQALQPGIIITVLLIIIAGLLACLIKVRHQFLDIKQKLDHIINQRTSTLSRANNELTNKIIEHEESQALLASTRNYYRSILNSLPAMIIGIDQQRNVTLWNSTAKTTTDIDIQQALHASVFKLIPSLQLYEKQISKAIENELPTIAEQVDFLLAGQKCYVDLSIHPLPETDTGAVILINDVTNRVEVEQLLVQNEKLLSLGEMAAGLAHEINNPLSAVLNNLQNLQRRTSLELSQNQVAASITGIDLNNLQDYFAERQIGQFFLGAREAAERAAAIVNNILKFAHSGQSAKGPEPINALIKDVVDLENKARFAAQNDEHYEHNMFVQLNAEQDICECSPPEIQQVVLNLIRNAIQACEQKGINAEVNIKTFNKNNCICIEVSDNGKGISPQDLPNVFDPFFTTKGVGEGTGLGLSVSYLIITEHHNGTIEVDSEEGKGTTFTVKLPLMV